MNDSERVKSKAIIDSSDSDSMSDSEFQNVAKKPKLDLARVSNRVQLIISFHKVGLEIQVLFARQIIILQQLLRVGR